MLLENYVEGKWVRGEGEGTALVDPVSGGELARVSSEGVDLGAALKFAREHGTRELQKLTYPERAALLGNIADVLSANRAKYFEICRKNMGASDGDASFDVDGAIYTIKQYAKWGAGLSGKLLKDEDAFSMSKSGDFQGQHFLKPLGGVAVFINAFNFPAWGLWEKAAPALLSGVAVLVKPATPTAWLTQEMVRDVVQAGVLPVGALNIVCGGARDLLDHLTYEDVVSFTGSAETAKRIKTNANVVAKSVRVNIEADSLNATILGEDVESGSDLFQAFVREVVKEMTQKAGQKCTAIRRVLVPEKRAREVAKAIADALAAVKVGAPGEGIGCGPVVNDAQKQAALKGLEELKGECETVWRGEAPESGSFVRPTLLYCEKPLSAQAVHEIEVFGPVATVMPYSGLEEAVELANCGGGSLVASVFSDDAEFMECAALGLAGAHGRLLLVNSAVAKQHTGHGNVMPNCLHGGPGRAGGGEELGGLRALSLYHRRFVVQGPKQTLAAIAAH